MCQTYAHAHSFFFLLGGDTNRVFFWWNRLRIVGINRTMFRKSLAGSADHLTLREEESVLDELDLRCTTVKMGGCTPLPLRPAPAALYAF